MSRMPVRFTTDKLTEILRNQGEDALSKHYSLGMWSICVQAADEIDRLCGLLQANGISSEAEYICRCGRRQEAPQGEIEF